jgi:hypothetical protein
MYDQPIRDLNPLILEAYAKKKILVMCAREGQSIRLGKKALPYDITIVGWWDVRQRHTLLGYDVAVIVDRDRVDPLFHDLLGYVERAYR